MATKKRLGTILLILGVGFFLFGSYTSYRVSQGEGKLSQAQEEQAGRRKPLIGPVRKGINSRMSESAQEKISEQAQEISASRVMASWLQGSGIVLVVVGMGCFIFRKRKNG